MPVSYSLADTKIEKFVLGYMKLHHQHLADADVQIEILMAANDTGPAVSHGGYPASAVIKIMSLKDRAAGCKDARMIIDNAAWDEYSPKEREALVDHELYHLVLATNDEGDVKRDDLDRPKLKIRKHDFQMGGWYSMCEKHGPNAIEGQSVAYVAAKLTQMEFDWTSAELMAAKGSGVDATESSELQECTP